MTKENRQIHDTTSMWMQNGVSKYGDDVCYKVLPGEFKAESQPDGSVKFKGWASTDVVDHADDIVEATAFLSSRDSYMKTGKMLYMHDWFSIPCGKITTFEPKDHGLWIEGYTLPTSTGQDVAIAIDHGTLDALSIGFKPIETTFNDDDGVRSIHDLELFEISFVNAGMNPDALFTQMKSLKLDTLTERKIGMPEVIITPEAIKKAEAMVGKFDETVESVNSSLAAVEAKTAELTGLINTIQEKQITLAKGGLDKSEYITFTKKIGDDLMDVRTELEKIGQKRQVIDRRDDFIEWQMKFATLVPRIHENGSTYTLIDSKAFSLIAAPVKYGDRNDGQLLKMFRDLNDIVVLTDSYMRGANKAGYDIRNLKSYRMMVELAEVIDPEFAKAMYSTGSGVGDDWVPTFMSSELFDLVEISAEVEMLFPHFDMPTNPYDWPIKTSHGTMYRAAEAATNNPDQLTKSDMGTSNVTFRAETFAIAMSTSPQLIEDSIVAIVPALREDMSYTAAKGYESLIINGDNAATHMDNGGSSNLWDENLAPETYEDGLRRYAKDASKEFGVLSATAGNGDGTNVFLAGDLRGLRKDMGVLGKDPSKVVYITGLAGYFQIMGMAQFAQPGTYEAGATWKTGALESIDGCMLKISSEIGEEQNTVGVYDDSTKTSSHVLCVNSTGFKVGSARSATVEFEKNIMTQQWTYVLTMRKSFQKMTASTQYPVANGFEILV